MGSTISKSKKKHRQSSTAQKPRTGLPSLSRERSVPQNPQEWSQVSPPGASSEDVDVDGPVKTISGKKSIRNSGNNSVPAQSNTTQPRTSTSNGRSSFSLIRGRKSSQIQRADDRTPEFDNSTGWKQQPPVDIDGRRTERASEYQQNARSSGSAFAMSMPEQSTLTKIYRSRQSLENRRGYPQYNQGQHQPPPVPAMSSMDSPRLTSGAYKAPVPAIPGSPATPSTPTLSVTIPSLASFPPPPQIATPPLPSSSSPTFLSPHPSSPSPTPGGPSPQESDRLWRESLRNAAAQAAASSAASESRRAEQQGLYRSNSNNSRASQSSSMYSTSGIGYGAGAGTGGSSRKQKQLSGSTFMTSATSISPSPSSASQSSSMGRHRSGKNNAIHPENESLDSSRSSGRHQGSLHHHQHYHQPQGNGGQFLLLPQHPTFEDNASVVSLAGSRVLGRDANILAAGENDSAMTSRNASVLSLMGSPVSSYPASSNIGGTNFDHPSSSSAKRWSQTDAYSSLSAEPAGLGLHASTVAPLAFSPNKSKTALDNHSSSLYSFGIEGGSGSGRDSMSSVSTANFQWMDEPPKEGRSLQDALQRDSVMMFLNNNDTPPSKTASQFLGMAPELGALSPEQLAQQRQEQRTVQHSLLKYFFRGNYHAPCNRQDLGSVLDVGCGNGLWMRDMALEFPLTEIHGVDLIVPTRPRRSPRVNNPLHTTTTSAAAAAALIPSSYPPPNYTSNGQSRNSSLHTTLQGNNYPTDTSSAVAEAVAAAAASTAESGVDSSPASTAPSNVTSPTIPESMPSNCFFHKADITTGLPFADNTFDFCHVRLVLWGYQLNCFPDLLTELVRVTKKGGWIEFVDMDPCIKKATETGMHINEWIKTGLIHSNMDPDLVRTMPKFLKEYCDATLATAMPSVVQPSSSGSSSNRRSRIFPSEPFGLSNLKVNKLSLPFGPWGGKVGELWQANYTGFLEDLEPMMIDATLSGLVMDQYHRQCQQEMMMRTSETGGSSSRPSSIDQKQCTHQAWSSLIQRLNQEADATASLADMDTATYNRGRLSPLLHGALLTSSSPLSSSPPLDDKEMRSYNNFYIAYAQKVDMVELRQQLLLERLEEEILSPNPNPNPDGFSTFPMTSLDARLEDQQPKHGFYSLTTQDGRQPNLDSGLLNTLMAQSSSTDVSSAQQTQELETNKAEMQEKDDRALIHRGRAIRNRNRYGLVAPLTEDALETFNRRFDEGDPRNDSTGPAPLSIQTPSSSAAAAPPTPTSIAALSIRSNSRGRGSPTVAVGAAAAGPGTPGSVTGSMASCLSPRVDMVVATPPGGVRPLNVGELRRQGSNPNLGISGSQTPQPQPQPQQQQQQDDNGEQEESGRTMFVPDYFNQIPIHQPSPTHQQQYQNFIQQQTNAVTRKSSLLSKVHPHPDTHVGTKNPKEDLPIVEKELLTKSLDHGEAANADGTMDLKQELDEESEFQKTTADKDEFSSMIVSLHEGDEMASEVNGVSHEAEMVASREFPATLVGLPCTISDQSPEGTVGMVAEHHVASNVVSPEEENHVASTVVVEHTGYGPRAMSANGRLGEHLNRIEERHPIDERVSPRQGVELSSFQEMSESESSVVDESELQLLPMEDSDDVDEEQDRQQQKMEPKHEEKEKEEAHEISEVVEEEEVLVMLAPEAAVIQAQERLGQDVSTAPNNGPSTENALSEIQEIHESARSRSPLDPSSFNVQGYQYPQPPFSLHPGAAHGHPINKDTIVVASPEPKSSKDLPRIPLKEIIDPKSGLSNRSQESALPRGRQGPGSSETPELTKAEQSSNNPVKKLRSKSKKWFKKL